MCGVQLFSSELQFFFSWPSQGDEGVENTWKYSHTWQDHWSQSMVKYFSFQQLSRFP